jgi:hypothetical protein
LPKGDDAEIERRWRIGLNGKFQQEIHNLAQLSGKWNALTRPTDTGPPANLRRSPVMPQDVDWTKPKTGTDPF